MSIQYPDPEIVRLSDLTKWFDTSAEISYADLEAAEAKIIADAVTRGNDAKDQGLQRKISEMKVAAFVHNEKLAGRDLRAASPTDS